MILVAEGPSAAGKTTWSNTWDSRLVVAETGRVGPPHELTPEEAIRFWIEKNCERWAHAIHVEATHGLAICDTDPLKLHYDYCLARLDLAPWDRFDLSVELATAAVRSRQLGIADLIICELPDDETLGQQRQADTTRWRRNFDLHRQFGPLLRDWYVTLDKLEPGRVSWGFPGALPVKITRDRFDTDQFVTWMSRLPRDPAGRQ